MRWIAANSSAADEGWFEPEDWRKGNWLNVTLWGIRAAGACEPFRNRRSQRGVHVVYSKPVRAFLEYLRE